MNLNEYINNWIRIQNNLNKTFSTYTNIQNQISVSFAPFVNLHNRINQMYEPILNFQSQISRITESINLYSNYYESLGININSRMQNLLQQQHRINELLSNSNLNISSALISDESSIKFNKISIETINELDFSEFPEEIIEIADSTLEITQQKNILTWEQIIIIITFIINITLFMQAQSPDDPNAQLTEIQNSLHELIEIQSTELDLLQQKFE